MKSNNIRKNKKYKIIALIIFAIFIIIAYNIFLLIISNYDDNDATKILGFKAYVITTESMSPAINRGDIIIIHEKELLKVGDIITFFENDTGEIITHRIAKITDDGYITKGDSNTETDSRIVHSDNIQGKVTLILPTFGNYIANLKKIRYIFIIVIVIITLILEKKRNNRKMAQRRLKKEIEDEKYRKEG